MELSPEDIRKDGGKILPQDFRIYIFFDDFCTVCNPYETELEDLCEMCKNEIGPEILKQWFDVREICLKHNFPSMLDGQRLLPFDDQDVIRDLLSRRLQFNPDYYRIQNPKELHHQMVDEEAKR